MASGPSPSWRKTSRKRGRRLALLLFFALAAGVAFWHGAGRRPPARAPDFSLPEVGGATVSLSALRGRAVILVFFRSYFCAPCRQQLAEFKRIYPAVKERGGELLVVSMEGKELSGRLKEEEGLPFPVLVDDGRAGRAYGVYGLLGDGLHAPAVFVVDGEGALRWKQVGRHFADLASPSRVKKEFRKAVGG